MFLNLLAPSELFSLGVDFALLGFKTLSHLFEILIQLFLPLLFGFGILLEFLEGVAQLQELAAALQPLLFQLGHFGIEVGVLLLHLLNLTLQHVAMLHQVVLLLNELVHHVFLVDAQSSTLLHQTT
eukprot:Skav207015  [mRNA]  locus=scaffold2740:95595:102330:+ [translate_table: standard]